MLRECPARERHADSDGSEAGDVRARMVKVAIVGRYDYGIKCQWVPERGQRAIVSSSRIIIVTWLA